MPYQHRFLDGAAMPAGKVVCVGRNYPEHARELGNPVPQEPLLFMKPYPALVALEAPIVLPRGEGSCHHEIELAALIGERLTACDAERARSAVVGYAVALDLTLRDLQDRLKQKGHPWEAAKAFDGACPISPFARPSELGDVGDLSLRLSVNGQVRQSGSTSSMIFETFGLIACMSRRFTLLPGDVVLTGTPPGVGALQSGDSLILELGKLRFETRVS